MIPTAVMVKLATLGLSPAQAEAVAGMLSDVETATLAGAEISQEQSKEKARARWRKWKEAQPTNVGKRLQPLANDSKRLTRGEDSSSKEDITNKEDRKKDAAPAALSDVEAFKAELPELEGDRLTAVLKHRKAKRAQISGHSAKLFRADAEACGMSITEAADTSISRNWITVKPEWLQGRQSTAPPRPPERTMNDVLEEMIQGKSDGYPGTTIEASFERADRRSAANLIQFDAVAARGKS